jgi:tRNA(fMet)-specific endonuclease VapC
MSYLLDADIISDLVRHRHGKVAQRIRELGEAEIVTSIIVAAELRFGVEKRRARRLRTRVEDMLATVDVLPFEVPADAVYARLRAQLEERGQPIGANDLLIAAHAGALSHTLVTGSAREFGRIAELDCENWLAA